MVIIKILRFSLFFIFYVRLSSHLFGFSFSHTPSSFFLLHRRVSLNFLLTFIDIFFFSPPLLAQSLRWSIFPLGWSWLDKSKYYIYIYIQVNTLSSTWLAAEQRCIIQWESMKGGAKQRASNFVVVKVAALVEQFLFFLFFWCFELYTLHRV